MDFLTEIDLQPCMPLSQVVFVHDYLQLIFQERSFTLYNLTTYSLGSGEHRQGHPGFCDALVSLIGQTARAEELGDRLLLHFSGGAVLSVSGAGLDARGPEAWRFGNLPVVKKNA